MTRRVVNTLRDSGTPAAGGDCPRCGKVRFGTKGDAKAAIRQMKRRDGKLRAYRCGPTENGTYSWHIGHTPAALIRGDITRDQIPPKKRVRR